MGMRILVPTLMVGKSGDFTNSYALGRLMPIWADSSCTLIVVFSICVSLLSMIFGFVSASSITVSFYPLLAGDQSRQVEGFLSRTG